MNNILIFYNICFIGYCYLGILSFVFVVGATMFSPSSVRLTRSKRTTKEPTCASSWWSTSTPDTDYHSPSVSSPHQSQTLTLSYYYQKSFFLCLIDPFFSTALSMTAFGFISVFPHFHVSIFSIQNLLSALLYCSLRPFLSTPPICLISNRFVSLIKHIEHIFHVPHHDHLFGFSFQYLVSFFTWW